MYRHVVLFRLRDEVSEKQRDEYVRILKDLGQENSDIKEWSVEISMDTRKGTIIVENSLFVSEDAYQRFRKSDKHVKSGEFMSKIADWWNGDYLES